MPKISLWSSIVDANRGAAEVVKEALKVARRNPQIFTYPYIALFFISTSYPLVSGVIFAHWYDRIFSEAGSVAPHKLSLILGLVGFSAFYTAFVTAYFTTAVSADVLAKLENRSVPPFYGLLRVVKNFFRVTRFAILSLFFLPAGIYAQRRKLPKGLLGVLGSSLTLHMAQVAPAILATPKKFNATIRDSVDTLGQFWKEGLVLKIWMYLAIFLIVALPKLVQHGFFKGHAASNVGWLISLEAGASTYVTLKVINSIFTTVLYHKAKSGRPLPKS